MNKFLAKWVCIIGICLAQLFAVTGAAAQTFDDEPPVIEHEVIESAPSADTQSFFATVADDDELNTVRFLYRFEGDTRFRSLDMNQVATSSTYSIELETEPDDGRAIQYYLEARDISGNRTLRGYNFSPLVRLIEVPQLTGDTVAVAGPTRVNRRPVYYVVGAVVAAALIGALVSGSGGGSDDGPAGPEIGECDNGLCDFTLTINAPGQ